MFWSSTWDNGVSIWYNEVLRFYIWIECFWSKNQMFRSYNHIWENWENWALGEFLSLRACRLSKSLSVLCWAFLYCGCSSEVTPSCRQLEEKSYKKYSLFLKKQKLGTCPMASGFVASSYTMSSSVPKGKIKTSILKEYCDSWIKQTLFKLVITLSNPP